MTTVLRVENLDYRVTPGDIRRFLKDHGVRPVDIHTCLAGNGKHDAIAMLIFMDRNEAETGLHVDGALFKDNRISVRNSNPKEFDKLFPGKPMRSKSNYFPRREERYTGVLKVENINYTATPGDIRRFFKEREARPADIHLVMQSNGGKHNGSAFLIFSIPDEADNALKMNGILFHNNRLSVKSSTPKEFDRFFPNVNMLSQQSNGRGRGRGINRGMNNRGGNISRPMPHVERRSPENNFTNGNMLTRGRGRGGRSGMRGGRGGVPGHNGRYSEFFNTRQEQPNYKRGRSRSPINSARRDEHRESSLRNFSGGQQFPLGENRRESIDRRFSNNPRFEEPVAEINERKFVRIYGLPYNASQVDIQDFFRPVLTRDIYIMRNAGGKFAGKFNGSAIVEFFSDGDARQAIKMDGKKFGHQSMSVIRPGKEDIERTIQENKSSNESNGTVVQPASDFSAINAIAQNNPQVQHLLTLLTATVNTIAGAAAAATQSKPENKREYRNDRKERNRDNRDDPVINRVASSANIDVGDIKLGRVVGVRNLPYTVTPNEILHFFGNYKVIPDSVRIHYLEDGRCSGDAIISFNGNRDARNAVSELNKGVIGRRKVELFFL